MPCFHASSCRSEQTRVLSLPAAEGKLSPCWRCSDRLVRVRRVAHCADCGCSITRYAETCKRCRGKRRTAAMPKKCTVEGCRWKARRGGKCMSHYWAGMPKPYERRRKAR